MNTDLVLEAAKKAVEVAAADLRDRVAGQCTYGACYDCERNIQRAKETLRKAENNLDTARAQAEENALRLLRLRQAGLRFANGVRYFLELEPIGELLPGDIGQQESCPITNTVLRDGGPEIIVSTTGSRCEVRAKDGTVLFAAKLPTAAREFVSAFDRGQFPDLKSAPKMDLV